MKYDDTYKKILLEKLRKKITGQSGKNGAGRGSCPKKNQRGGAGHRGPLPRCRPEILKKTFIFHRKIWFLGNSAQQLSSAQQVFSQLSSLSSGKSLGQLSSAQLSYFFQNLQLCFDAFFSYDYISIINLDLKFNQAI